MVLCLWGKELRKIIQIFLISLIAFQPLHSYTVIDTSFAPQDNGFHLPNGELCGSSISHTKKLSDLLDRLNTALLANMPEDCVCCNSVDINSTEIITVQYLNFGSLQYNKKNFESYYHLNVKSLIKLTNESRAPPLV